MAHTHAPPCAVAYAAAHGSMIRRKPQQTHNPKVRSTVNPRDLLETARRPAESGASHPTQTDLRRAVSTAYYALFHCLAAAAADLLTGNGSRGPEWHQVYRALEHGKARKACQHKR